MEIKHFSQRELALRWGVSEACLERWRTLGCGPVYLKLHGRVLYRIEDVEVFEVESLRKSTSERFDKGDVA
ncbi:DNA-binding protein [Hahella sp. HN01]|uniref:DNA-binding protein n=1 Tax=Hahella sp. HN01 TaxID=2847262 RepID=UPI001C1ED43E|nr:DNA-binding protein [Hahella sp. HN01]